jgi:hypothetical protein
MPQPRGKRKGPQLKKASVQKDLASFIRSSNETQNQQEAQNRLLVFDVPYTIWVEEEAHQQPTRLTECIAEVRAFVHGGTPGLARLELVYPSLLTHFRVRNDVDFYHVMYEARAPLHVWKEWPPPSQLFQAQPRSRRALPPQ